MRSCVYFILILFVCVMCAQAQSISNTASSNDRMEALEKICKQQEEQIKKLQQRLGVLDNEESYKQYTQKIVKEYLKEPQAEEAAAGVVAGYDNGFFVRSADGDYELKMTGLIQMGLGIFENNSLDNNSVYPAGVYVAFDVYYKKVVHGRVEIDFADTGFENQFRGVAEGVTLRDAYIEYLPMPEFNIRIGQTHVPFTMAGQYAPNGDIPIWSAPFIQSWSHGRDPGIMLHGMLENMLEYKLSVHNGNNNTNEDDNFLMAGQLRAYFLGHDKNPNTFFHIGGIRSRSMAEGANDNDINLYTPWGRLMDDTAVRGWKTGGDAGIRFDQDLEGGHNVRVESELMYMLWERDLNAGRETFLRNWGVSFGATYRHCLDATNPGSGIFPAFAFSYTDVDDKSNHHSAAPGVRLITYTVGLGYAFNKHLSMNVNWVMVDDLDKTAANGPKDGNDSTDDLEHAWFLQFTAVW